jgi:hypothetical protein
MFLDLAFAPEKNEENITHSVTIMQLLYYHSSPGLLKYETRTLTTDHKVQYYYE